MLLRSALLLAGVFVFARGQAPGPDLILYNGIILTVDARASTAEAIAVRGDTPPNCS